MNLCRYIALGLQNLLTRWSINWLADGRWFWPVHGAELEHCGFLKHLAAVQSAARYGASLAFAQSLQTADCANWYATIGVEVKPLLPFVVGIHVLDLGNLQGRLEQAKMSTVQQMNMVKRLSKWTIS